MAGSARKAAHTVAGNLNLIVEVRGNVSAQEARRNTERAWDLSYRRAQAVAQVLIGEGMPASHLRLVACGDGNPLKLRADTPGDSRTNQRVELVIIKERPKTDEFSDQGDDAPKTNK